MTIETKAREWAEDMEIEVNVLAIMKDDFIRATKTVAFESYLAGAAEAARWVPVSERLPEKDQRVLAIDSMGYIEICKYSRFCNDKEYSFCDEQDEQPGVLTAIAWMPLPQP